MSNPRVSVVYHPLATLQTAVVQHAKFQALWKCRNGKVSGCSALAMNSVREEQHFIVVSCHGHRSCCVL